MDISVNHSALELVEELIDQKDKLNCKIIEQNNGSTVIDAGIGASGSREAGRLIAEICLGGQGAVRFTTVSFDAFDMPGVVVGTNRPKLATLASQYAGWSIKVDDFFAMASGPARSLARVEKLFDELQYQDNSSKGVLFLETRNIPSDKVTEYIADKCNISPSELVCIVAPTACDVGSIQIAARIVEVGVHKLHELGLHPDKICTGHGIAPIAPVAKKDSHAMGWTNDCILYAGRTFFNVRLDETDDMASMIKQAPSIASTQYGKPFYKLFKGFGFEFYKVDPMLFSPAEVTVTDITSGAIYTAGSLNISVLKQSLGLQNEF